MITRSVKNTMSPESKSSGVTLSERIIEAVKRHTILYDMSHPDNKNLRKKDLVWSELGKELNLHVEVVKKKWKNIRDCYLKYLKSLESYPSRRNYSNWQWAGQMEIFKPYFLARPKLQYGLSSEIEIKTENFDDIIYQEDESNDPDDPKSYHELFRKRKYDDISETLTIEPQLTIQEEPKFFNQMDAMDLIFLGYSKTVKLFSQRRQAMVKMKIAKILLDEELEHIDEVEKTNST